MAILFVLGEVVSDCGKKPKLCGANAHIDERALRALAGELGGSPQKEKPRRTSQLVDSPKLKVRILLEPFFDCLWDGRRVVV